MNRVYLLLGSNLDDRVRLLETARTKIASEIGTIIALSLIYESEPWGFQAEQYFLNQVVVVESELTPSLMLTAILSIEMSLGRHRSDHGTYESRPIDIDILFFNTKVIRSKILSIPHPRIQDRRFALVPMGELDENFLHPCFHKTIGQLLTECRDGCKVTVFEVHEKKNSTS